MVLFFAGVLLIGVLSAVASQTASGMYLEEELGLSWLFNLRGSVAAPKNVIIISIDQVSAEILRLGEDPEKWPRSYFTNLIEKLNQQNPAVIAFNIHFSESRNVAGDTALAKAMAASRKIILSNYLRQYTPMGIEPNSEFSYERIINPIPIFQDAALSSSPFPLAKTPTTIKTFWTFKSSAGDIPTFPVTVFQYYLFKESYAEIKQILKQIDPDIASSLPESFPPPGHMSQTEQLSNCDQIIAMVKATVTRNEQVLEHFSRLLTADFMSQDKTRLLRSWLALIKGGESLYLNHYGKIGTIITIPFYQVLVAEFLKPELFKNSIVLVGYSDRLEPEKNQGFFTSFSTGVNDTVSPIEIAATAVANLVEQSWVVPLKMAYQTCAILLWGVILAGIVSFTQYRKALLIIVALSLSYALVVVNIFMQHSLRIPLFMPLAIQMPMAVLLATFLHFLTSRQERRHIHKAFSFYIPHNVVNSLSQQPKIDELHTYGELLQGVCMATDAGEYTALGENLNPSELNRLLNSYYSIMFPLVKHYQGMVSDVMGDAMLAVWASSIVDRQLRIKACETALAIKAAIEEFNCSQPYQLHTRIGLHFGEMRLGNVGAQDHFEYRAVGDVVNTATRIEGLNKLLGTKILVSWNVLQGIDSFNVREVGAFIFKGKTQPVTLFELFHSADLVTPYCPSLVIGFNLALQCFQKYRWQEALEMFQTLHQEFPQDGPTVFYVKYLQHHLNCIPQPDARNQIAVIDIGR